MNWHFKSSLKPKASSTDIIKALLKARGQTTKDQVASFLHSTPPAELTPCQVGITAKSLNLATKRLQQAHVNQETIVIFGDYDADGICATAILWETLHHAGFSAHPFIPHREKHGYGLSIKGLQQVIATYQPSLVITVDNGIVANQAAEFLANQKVDLIITDHHQPSSTKPKAISIIHSLDICGAAVAWIFSKHLSTQFPASSLPESIDLVGIATIADLMPMTGVNRSFAKYGLQALATTKRPGLVALKESAEISELTTLSTYHIGFVIGPRINAMGRLKHGLDALRLLCTTDPSRALQLAQTLTNTNHTRQDLTAQFIIQADTIYQSSPVLQQSHIIIIDHPDFHEGIIGLIAGKLTEKYHKPSIVISRGTKISKASARSISGVNIIDFIRTHQHFLINAGGHPGAAGFSLETTNISPFTDSLIQASLSHIDKSLLLPTLSIDLSLDLNQLSFKLYHQIDQFQPFGIGNPRPVFATTAQLVHSRVIGKSSDHLKLQLTSSAHPEPFDAIGFNLAHFYNQIQIGQDLQFAFTLDQNTWNDNTSLQLHLKDIKPSS